MISLNRSKVRRYRNAIVQVSVIIVLHLSVSALNNEAYNNSGR